MNKRKVPAILILSIIFITLFVACSERETVKEITVSFKTDGGSKVASVNDGVVEEFPISEKDGYLIENWYFDEEKTDRVVFPFKAGESCVLYAKWISTINGNSETEYVPNEDRTGYVADKYNGNAYSVCIPDVYNGMPVLGVSDYFLIKRNYVNVIYIGKFVQYVGKAFERCSVLREFQVNPENTELITDDTGALYNYDKSRLLYYPSASENEIYALNAKADKNAFYLCPNLKELIFDRNAEIQSAGLEKLIALEKFTVKDDNGIYKSQNGILFSKDLKELIRFPSAKNESAYTITDDTETIAYGAFFNSLIKQLRIGKNLKEYNDYTEAPNLENIFVDDGNPYFSDREGVLFDKDETELLRFPCARISEYSIPDGTHTIGEFAFAESKKLVKLIMPASLKTIRGCAFYDCQRLADVNASLSVSLDYIEGNAFSGCSGLKYFTVNCAIPPYVGEEVFSVSGNRVKVIVPSNAELMYKTEWARVDAEIIPNGLPLTEYTVTFLVDNEIYHSYHGVYLYDGVFPEKEGYVFEGWYDNEKCVGEKIEFPLIINDHMYLYAFFEEKPQTDQ